jgi:hypothetical protein
MEQDLVKTYSRSLLLAILFWGIHIVGNCQSNAQVNLKAVIQVKKSSNRLDSLLTIISSQSNVKFSYNTKKLLPQSIITGKTGTQTLESILEQVKNKTGYAYKIVGAHIIFLEPSAPAPQTISKVNPPVKQPVINKNNKNNPSSSAITKAAGNTSNTSPGKTDTGNLIVNEPVVNDTVVVRNDTLAAVKPAQKDSVVIKPRTDTSMQSSSLQRLDKNTSTANSSGREKNTTETDLRTLFMADLGPQGIGVTLETRISKKIIIDFSVGAGGSYSIDQNDFSYNWDIFKPSLYGSITPKWYYNRNRRAQKGRSTNLNAGDYIGIRAKLVTIQLAYMIDIFDAALINIHWGLQRPISRKISFNTHIGVGYASNTELQRKSGTIYPAIDIKLSYIFSRTK